MTLRRAFVGLHLEHMSQRRLHIQLKAHAADKLFAAPDSMASPVMGIVDWKSAMRMNLIALDYGKWLKALKLDDSEHAKQLVVDFEYATRDAPVSTWTRAFDKIIASFAIPKARGSQWLDVLRRMRLVPTFEWAQARGNRRQELFIHEGNVQCPRAKPWVPSSARPTA